MSIRVSVNVPQNSSVVSFKNRQNAGKSVVSFLQDMENIHLDDKVSILLNNLEKDEFLMVAPKLTGEDSYLKRLMSIFGESIKGLYNVENSKFNEALTFFKENGIVKFVNINYEPLKVNTRNIKPFYGCDIKSGDRLWGSTLRSLLIKDKPDTSESLARNYGLMADRYDRTMLCEMEGSVFKRPPHRLGA